METNEVVNDTASFEGDVPPILPDGWKEGDALVPDGDDELAKLLADGSEEEPLTGLEEKDVNPVSAAPTTGGADAGSVPDAGAQPGQTPSDGAGETPVHASRKLRLKVNHEEREVDLGAMSDEEVCALLQKGYAFDAKVEAENKSTYRRVYQEQIDAGMTDAAARMIARDAAGGKVYELTDEPANAAPAQPAPTMPAPAMPAPGRDLRAEVQQLRSLYPDLHEIPEPVAKAVSQGANVLTAYLAYRDTQGTQTAASLQKENTILKQNAARAQQAPVRGVTGGDLTQQKAQSIFEKAFDEGFNWN